MYCVKCKRKTNTTNLKQFMSKNNKPMMRGKCKTCGNVKTQFVPVNKKTGGFVFTIPALMAGIGAAASLAGGASGIATAVNKKKAADKMLQETKRHNKAMEGRGISLKKRTRTGKGLYLKPYKR